MDKQRNILNIIKEIRKVLEKDEYRKNRYENDIEWFKNREKIADGNIIRIAIIGVTSSGKSTLVNSILGEKILPIAIKPSSSIIITCSKGHEREGIVYFRDKEPLSLKGEYLNEEIIKKYADESSNANNKYNVTQIDIKSPKFLLDDNIQIIDSPGLDACDLEMHEKLTLEILLPTIDICVFLTTVKASSDNVNKEKIITVFEKDKEIIMVQNMIDSIEPKLGKNGIIEEDNEVILEKHRKRAENILHVATSGKNSSVIQISAINAFKGIVNNNKELFDISNIQDFIDAVKECVRKVTPKINNERILSLKQKINFIIDMDEEIIKDTSQFYDVETKEIDELVYKFQEGRQKINEKIKEIDNITIRTIENIKKEDSKEVSNYLEIIWQINKENFQIEKDILDIVRNCEVDRQRVYRKLNLDIRYSYTLPSHASESLDINDITMKHEEKVRLIKKDGAFNKGKRLVSNILKIRWGYDEEEYGEEIIDKDATIAKVCNVCDKNKDKYIDILYDWSSQYTDSLNKIYAVLKENSENYDKKRNADIDIYNIKQVYDELIDLRDDLDYITKDLNIDDNLLKTKKALRNLVNTHISMQSFNIFKYANSIVEKNYLIVGNYIRKNIQEEVIWFYDINTCVEFLYRIKKIILDDEKIKILITKGILKIENVLCVYENCVDKDELLTRLEGISGISYNMYLMINGIQIGSSDKQICTSIFLRQFVFKNKVRINFVIDSTREFINAGIIKELLYDMNNLKIKILKLFNFYEEGYLLINSKNPIYNLTLIECQECDKFILSAYKEVKERLFGNFLAHGLEEKQIIEEILMHFLKDEKAD